MTTLYLVRHAEHALAGRYVGRLDPPLTPRGRAQAEALAERLAREPLGAVYSSPLQRAAETARAVALRQGLEVQAREGLAEAAFGAWEGLTYAEIEARDRAALAAWLADPLTTAPPGGETLAALSARVVGCLDQVRAAHPEGAVAVVSHGGPLRAAICAALGLEAGAHWSVQVDVASVSVLTYWGESATLVRLNCTEHIEERIKDE